MVLVYRHRWTDTETTQWETCQWSAPQKAPIPNASGLWTAVPGLSTLVQSRSGDNLEVTVSAEVYTTSAVWLRAVVDGQPQEPDVVFKAGGENWDGIRSYNFVKKNVPGGTRTVEVQWYTNPDTVAEIRDCSLVVNSASPSWGSGRLAVAAPVSGPDVVKTTSTWEDIPGLSTTLTTDLPRNFRITFSAEADADSGDGPFFSPRHPTRLGSGTREPEGREIK